MNAVTIRWKAAFEVNCAFWYEAWLEYVLDGCCALHCIVLLIPMKASRILQNWMSSFYTSGLRMSNQFMQHSRWRSDSACSHVCFSRRPMVRHRSTLHRSPASTRDSAIQGFVR